MIKFEPSLSAMSHASFGKYDRLMSEVHEYAIRVTQLETTMERESFVMANRQNQKAFALLKEENERLKADLNRLIEQIAEIQISLCEELL